MYNVVLIVFVMLVCKCVNVGVLVIHHLQLSYHILKKIYASRVTVHV